jgi:hypothetical protein
LHAERYSNRLGFAWGFAWWMLASGSDGDKSTVAKSRSTVFLIASTGVWGGRGGEGRRTGRGRGGEEEERGQKIYQVDAEEVFVFIVNKQILGTELTVEGIEPRIPSLGSGRRLSRGSGR